jgi:hypothetical protein
LEAKKPSIININQYHPSLLTLPLLSSLEAKKPSRNIKNTRNNQNEENRHNEVVVSIIDGGHTVCRGRRWSIIFIGYR